MLRVYLSNKNVLIGCDQFPIGFIQLYIYLPCTRTDDVTTEYGPLYPATLMGLGTLQGVFLRA